MLVWTVIPDPMFVPMVMMDFGMQFRIGFGPERWLQGWNADGSQKLEEIVYLGEN